MQKSEKKKIKHISKSPLRKKEKYKSKFENSIKIRGIENKPMLLSLLTNCTRNLKGKAQGYREGGGLTERSK